MPNKNDTRKPSAIQRTFDIFNDKPATENPIHLGEKIRRADIDGMTYFSILDLFEHYGSKGSAVNPSVYWARVEKRLRKQTGLVSDEVITGVLAYTFEGTKRPTPAGTMKLFMRIAQVSEIKEWETIRDWMAQVAVERIEETINPELGIERAQERFLEAKINQGMSEDEAKDFLVLVQEGHVSRRQWTDVLRNVVRGVIQYGIITDAQYIILFGMKAKRITEETGFKPARDGMTLVGRQITNACDIALVSEFKRHKDLTFWQAVDLAKEVCSDFSPTIKLLEARMGVSLATGKPLLGEGRK